MGRLLAFMSHHEGWQVTIFDKNRTTTQAFNCSHAAAGLLTPISELDKASPLIYHLGMEALDKHWPAILAQLADSIFFQREGCLVLHHPQDKPEWLQFSHRIQSKLGDGFYQALTPEALATLEPELSQINCAYFLPHEGQIDSQAILLALEHALSAFGVIWHKDTHVTAMKNGQITTEHSTHQFDLIIDCRGMGAKSVFSDLRALRGELMWLYAPEVNINRPVRFLHPRYSLYLVPRPNHLYLIGASELESEDYSPISVRTTLELLTAAYSIHAGFAEARVIKSITHCRPTLPHHLPSIKMADKFIAVNGLYRHGYLIAPTLAAEIILGLKSNQQYIHYPMLWETFHDNHLH